MDGNRLNNMLRNILQKSEKITLTFLTFVFQKNPDFDSESFRFQISPPFSPIFHRFLPNFKSNCLLVIFLVFKNLINSESRFHHFLALAQSKPTKSIKMKFLDFSNHQILYRILSRSHGDGPEFSNLHFFHCTLVILHQILHQYYTNTPK